MRRRACFDPRQASGEFLNSACWVNWGNAAISHDREHFYRSLRALGVQGHAFERKVATLMGAEDRRSARA